MIPTPLHEVWEVTDDTPAAQFLAMLYAGQTGILELRTFGPEDADQSPKAHHQRAAAYRLRDFVPVVNGRKTRRDATRRSISMN